MSILKLKDSQGNWISVPTVKGDTGNGISSAILNDDYTLTLTFTDGTTYKTPSIRGEKGEKGEPATDMEIHICSANEYDAETRMPTIANPNDKTFYLVPTEDGASPDLFTEWVYVNSAWEMFGSMKIDLSGYVKDTDLDEVEEKVEQNTEDLLKAFPVETASGSIVSFEDGANGIPLQSLVVDINPVQDLHGYDSPWVGGAGKNILPYASQGTDSDNGITWIKNSDGSITFSGTCTKASAMNFVEFKLPAGEYLYSNVGSTTSYNGGEKRPVTYIRDLDNSVSLANIGFGQTSNGVRFTLSTETNIRFYVVFQMDNVVSGTLYPMIRLASVTDSTYAPYENICPINGWTEVDVYDDPMYGGNIEWNQLMNLTTSTMTANGLTYTNNNDGSFNISGTASVKTNFMLDRTQDNYIVPKHIYALFGCPQGGSRSTFAFGIGGLPIEFGNGQIWTNPSYSRGYPSFTVFANQTIDFQNVRLQIFDLTQMFGEGNEPSTVEEFKALFPNDYYPYNTGEKTTVSAVNEKSYTHVNIQLGHTVYGGKLDVLTGKLVIDRAMVDLGTLNWISEESYSIGQFRVSQMEMAQLNPNYSLVQCSVLNGVRPKGYIQFNNGEIGLSNSPTAPILRAKAEVFIGKTAEEIKAIMQGQQLCYELAEPIEIQLSPNQMNSLYGANNIWADTGDTSVEYRADPELYIEKTKPVINVDDVQINGTSIVEDGIANIPIASTGKKGIVQIQPYFGVNINSAGDLYINSATSEEFKNGSSIYKPIVPNNQHLSTFYGLAKASGADEKNSTLPVGQYTDNAKDSIQNMLGITPLIASHETDPFESAHVIGELFIIGGKLYRAKTALTAGEYINEGTNVEVVNVTEVLDDYATKQEIENNINIIEKSNSGSIVSFEDGVNNVPLKSLIVDINPVQDLHGQDRPYPAGSGKNKANVSDYSQSFTNVYYIDKAIGVTLEAGVTYTFSCDVNSTVTPFSISAGVGSSGVYRKDIFTKPSNDNGRVYITFTPTAEQLTDYTEFYVRIPRFGTSQTGTVSVSKIQLEIGSTATDYAPYENICPISGWTEVGVEQSGVNLFDKAMAVTGYIDDKSGNLKPQGAGQNSKATDYILVKPNATYYISSEQTKGAWGAWYDKDKNYISGITGYSATSSEAAKLKVAPYNAYYMRLTVEYYTYSDDTINGNIDTFSVNYPSTDHDYHPYTGRSITINLGQTVYGAHIDVISGVMTIDMAMVDLGTLNWTSYSLASNSFSALLTDGKATRTNYSAKGNCSIYALADYITALRDGDKVFGIGYINLSAVACFVAVHDTSYTDATSFKAAMSGVQLCYELAEPITIQLTPHEVNSILGANNIWADSGDTSVEYFSQVDEDLIDYIETSLKPYAKEEKLNDYVSDIQIDGTTIVKNGIAEIPFATSNAGGVVKVDSSLGIKLNDTNKLLINRATTTQTKAGTDAARPIVPICQHESVFYGLTKAAGVDMASSSNEVGVYTEEAKSAISDMLNGAVQISGTDPTINAMSGIRYICGEVLSLNFTPSANGICDVMFTSGSTPTVLTLPDTVKMPKWFIIEANTTYEINIADGIYGAVTSWTL